MNDIDDLFITEIKSLKKNNKSKKKKNSNTSNSTARKNITKHKKKKNKRDKIKSVCDKERHVAPPPKKIYKGRRKIEIEYIPDKTRRCTTRSKRMVGLMKKARELHVLTNDNVFLYVMPTEGNVSRIRSFIGGDLNLLHLHVKKDIKELRKKNKSSKK